MTAGNAKGGEFIFGRFTREECGLPPVASRHKRVWLRCGLWGACLLAALFLVGWMAGAVSAKWREAWLYELPARVAASPSEDAPGLLITGRLYAIALSGRGGMRRDLALATLAAAEKSPRRMGYYGNAAALLAGAGVGSEEAGRAADFGAELSASGLYAEVGDYPAAFRAVARAESALSGLPDDAEARARRLLLVNAQAYYLSTAPEGQGRDADRALRLAELLVTSRDALPDGLRAGSSAAFLDTLAVARAASGRAEEARGAQSYALGMAGLEGLDVYIRHFDEIENRIGSGAASGRDVDNGK